jgi:hypothetical protein
MTHLLPLHVGHGSRSSRYSHEFAYSCISPLLKHHIGSRQRQTLSGPRRCLRQCWRSGSKYRLLDHRDLALVDLEVDQLRRFLFPSRQFLLHHPPEVLLRQLSSFVQPGCTIEVLTAPARDFHQFDRLWWHRRRCGSFWASALVGLMNRSGSLRARRYGGFSSGFGS